MYKTTNIINQKFYIGKHQTKNLDDGYMGSGKILKRAVAKHGIENFKKEILHVFDNEQEMNAKEKELVVICEESYNLCEGGQGGFSYIHRNGLCDYTVGRKAADKALEQKYGPDWRQKVSRLGKNYKQKQGFQAYLETEQFQINKDKSTKKLNGSDSIEKRNETFKKNGHQQGSKNSNYGKCWITNGTESKPIPKSDLDIWINQGYRLGRILK